VIRNNDQTNLAIRIRIYYLSLAKNKYQKRGMLQKHLTIFLTAICFLCLAYTNQASSQTIKLLGGNTLNGAVTGVALGGSVMGLQNSDDFAPLRVGLGAGTLFGIGVGFHDISKVSKGEQFYISATFNDGTNTSIIVLLDTFYGAAAGAIIASSITLISNEPIVDALQYGSSAGAWAGFGFGLIDAFVLAQGPGDFAADASGMQEADGLLHIAGKKKRINVGLVSPSLISYRTIEAQALKKQTAFNLKLLNLNVNF
jgi:hypothetical protein